MYALVVCASQNPEARQTVSSVRKGWKRLAINGFLVLAGGLALPDLIAEGSWRRWIVGPGLVVMIAVIITDLVKLVRERVAEREEKQQGRR